MNAHFSSALIILSVSVISSCFKPSIVRSSRSTGPAASVGLSIANSYLASGSVTQARCSGNISFFRFDSLGQLTYPNSTTALSFSGYTNGVFYSSTDCSGSPITSATILAGSASVDVSYRNYVSGTEIVSIQSNGLSSTTYTMTILPQFGNRTDFTFPGAFSFCPTFLDLKNDGVIDYAFISYVNHIYTGFGNGDGTFATAVDTPTVGASSSFGKPSDLDGDGNIDMVIPNVFTTVFTVYWGDAAGAFPASNNYNYNVSNNEYVDVMDYDADGYKDIVIGQRANAQVFIAWGSNAARAAKFGATTTLAVGNTPKRIVSGDFNGDGRIDMLVANSTSDTISFVRNDGARAFTVLTAYTYAGGTAPIDIATADLDGDGVLDIVVSQNSQNKIAYHKGNGDGTFQVPTTYSVATNPVGLKLSDLNGDGILDLIVVSNVVSPALTIWYGQGAGVFRTPSVTFATPADKPYQIDVADTNNDGKPDLLVGSSSPGGTTSSFYLSN